MGARQKDKQGIAQNRFHCLLYYLSSIKEQSNDVAIGSSRYFKFKSHNAIGECVMQ